MDIEELKKSLANFLAMNSPNSAYIFEYNDEFQISLNSITPKLILDKSNNDIGQYIAILNNSYFPRYLNGAIDFKNEILELPFDTMRSLDAWRFRDKKYKLKINSYEHECYLGQPSCSLKMLAQISRRDQAFLSPIIAYQNLSNNYKEEFAEVCRPLSVYISNINLDDARTKHVIKHINYLSYNKYIEFPFIEIKELDLFYRDKNFPNDSIPEIVDNGLLNMWSRVYTNSNNAIEFFLSLFRIIENVAIRYSRDEIFRYIKEKQGISKVNKIEMMGRIFSSLKDSEISYKSFFHLFEKNNLQEEVFNLLRCKSEEIANIDTFCGEEISVKEKYKKDKNSYVDKAIRNICKIRNLLSHGGVNKENGMYVELTDDNIKKIEPWIKVIYDVACLVTNKIQIDDNYASILRGKSGSVDIHSKSYGQIKPGIDTTKSDIYAEKDASYTCKSCKIKKFYKRGMKIEKCLHCGGTKFEYNH